jgi:hypothetical protein
MNSKIFIGTGMALKILVYCVRKIYANPQRKYLVAIELRNIQGGILDV